MCWYTYTLHYLELFSIAGTVSNKDDDDDDKDNNNNNNNNLVFQRSTGVDIELVII